MRPIFHIFSETKKLFFDFASFTANITMRAMRFSKCRFGIHFCRLKLGQNPFTIFSSVDGSIPASFSFGAFSRFAFLNFYYPMKLVQKMVIVIARHLAPQFARICDSPTAYVLNGELGKLYVAVDSLCISTLRYISASNCRMGPYMVLFFRDFHHVYFMSAALYTQFTPADILPRFRKRAFFQVGKAAHAVL